MRADISLNRPGWLFRLDHKKLIIIVFLLRLIMASAYDMFVTVTGKDILLPDSKFYSLRGRYVDLVLQGNNDGSFPKDLIPGDKTDRALFIDAAQQEGGVLPVRINESNMHFYVVGILYHLFGYFNIWVRIFNICISILSAYLLFMVAKRHFGDLAANIFLITALFLPTQFGYSITLSRDFLRVFIVSFTIWAVYYIGDIWVKKLRSRLCC